MNNQDYQQILYQELETKERKLKKIRLFLFILLAISGIGLLFGFMITFTSIPLMVLYGKGLHDSMMIYTLIWFGFILLLMYLSYQHPTIVFIVLSLIAGLELMIAYFRFEQIDIYNISLVSIRIISLSICIYGLIISAKKKQLEDILYHD